MQTLVIAQLLLLLLIANGTPIIAKRIFGHRFTWPLDAGVSFFDGKPLFGRSKTIRGIVSSVFVTTALAPLIGLCPFVGATVAATAMCGDLVSSFVKRRLNMPASSRAVGLDQVPESLLPLLACRSELSLTLIDILVCLAVFFVGEVLLSKILYKLHIRDRPY